MRQRVSLREHFKRGNAATTFIVAGHGSMCRRHVGGPNGILAVLEALDSAFAGTATRFHLPDYPSCSASFRVIRKENMVLPTGESMARNAVQFQRGLSEAEFERLYGTKA